MYIMASDYYLLYSDWTMMYHDLSLSCDSILLPWSRHLLPVVAHADAAFSPLLPAMPPPPYYIGTVRALASHRKDQVLHLVYIPSSRRRVLRTTPTRPEVLKRSSLTQRTL